MLDSVGEPSNLDAQFLRCGLLALFDWVRSDCRRIAQSPSDYRRENTVTTDTRGTEALSVMGDFESDHAR